MKRILILSSLLLTCFFPIQAQDNVANIAHSFIKAVKSNDIERIQKRFLNVSAAYPILPRESAGMNAKQKKETYIKPMHQEFEDNFKTIQAQIKDENIDARKIDLISYKLEKKKNKNKIEPIAMSLFFNYKKKEHILPISVVQIDERWYILEILNTSNLFQ